MALRGHYPEQRTEHERAAIALHDDVADILPPKFNGVRETRYKAYFVGTDDHSAPRWWTVRGKSNQHSPEGGLHDAIMTLVLGQSVASTPNQGLPTDTKRRILPGAE